MKKNFCRSVILVVLIFALCTGCAGYTTGDETGVNVTGSAVSGSAVAEDAAGREAGAERYLFANSTNVYRGIGGSYSWEVDGKGGFVQYSRTGEKQETFDQIARYAGLVSVTEEGVYYYTRDNDMMTKFYRMPIEKKVDGTDRLKPEQVEMILEAGKGGFASNAYIDENYIVYNFYDMLSDNIFHPAVYPHLIKYNRKTGEKTEIEPAPGMDVIATVGSDYIIFADNNEACYRLDLNSDQAVKIVGNKSDDEYTYRDPVMAAYGDYFFFSEEQDDKDEIFVYNVKSRETKKLLSKEQLEKACRQVPTSSAPLDIKKEENICCHLTHMFCQGGRLYVQVQLDRGDKKREWMCYVVFGMDISDLDGSGAGKVKLRYEKELMDCIWSHSENETYKITKDDEEAKEDGYGGYEAVAWNPGLVVAMQPGKAILVLNKFDGDQQMVGCYDFETGLFRKIKEGDEEYCTLYYNTQEPFGYEDFCLDNDDMELMPGFLSDEC